jgi:transcription initiation factor IIE alpha subunit
VRHNAEIGYRRQTEDLPLFSGQPEIAKAVDTKREAYAGAVRRGLSDSAMRIFDCILHDGPISNMEISQKLAVPINRVTPRVYELRQQGMVTMDVRRACRVTGMQVRTWVVPVGIFQQLCSEGRRAGL